VELIVRRGERVERVRVEPEGTGYRVHVGETVFHVDQARTGHHERSLLIDGAQREVAVLPRGDGRYLVSTGERTAEVEVSDPLTHLAQQSASARAGRRLQRIVAYMPGRVVELLVEEGQEVTAGQGLAVLEAMKMENEIQAELAGRVARIHVEAGQAVEGGDLLFELT
jgi:biotin carboxyl carrier protein